MVAPRAQVESIEQGQEIISGLMLVQVCTALNISIEDLDMNVQVALISQAAGFAPTAVVPQLPVISVNVPTLLGSSAPVLAPVRGMLLVVAGQNADVNGDLEITGRLLAVIAGLCGLTQLVCWQLLAGAIRHDLDPIVDESASLTPRIPRVYRRRVARTGGPQGTTAPTNASGDVPDAATLVAVAG
jgi:hypothetical protein